MNVCQLSLSNQLLLWNQKKKSNQRKVSYIQVAFIYLILVDVKPKEVQPYANAPVLHSVNPSVLSTSGGQTTVTGSNFSPQIAVFIDSKKMKVDFINSGMLQVTTPALVKGEKNIKLVNPDGAFVLEERVLIISPDMPSDVIATSPGSRSSLSLPLSFFRSSKDPKKSAIEDPLITTINPAAVPLYGGVSVKVIGTNFEINPTLKISGKTVPVKVTKEDNEDVLSFNAPSSDTVGFKTVEVITKSGKQAILNNVLLYYDDTPTGVKQGGRVWGKA